MKTFSGSAVEPLEILVRMIFQQYLNESYCVTIITEIDFNFNFPGYVPNIWLKNGDDIFHAVSTSSDKGCSDYIVQMTQTSHFMKIFDKMTLKGKARRSDRKLILLPSFKDSDKENLLNVLASSEASHLCNILLILPVDKSKQCEVYDLVTHKFIGSESESKEPIYLDRWDSCTNSFERNENLFPPKMDNLYGKTVRVSCFNHMPFSMFDLDKAIELIGRDGIDIRMVDELCRRINCTVEFIIDDENKWGAIFENGTGIGVLGNVFEDRADLGISGLGAWYNSYLSLDLSEPIVRCSVTSIVPAPSISPKFELLLLPFGWIIWTLIVLVSIYTALALLVAQRFSMDGIIFRIYKIWVAQSQADSHPDWRVRCIVGWLLVAILIINNGYSAGLATSLTITKYEPSIDTIQDLVDRDMPWAAVHEAWTLTMLPSQDPKTQKLVKLFRKYDSEILKEKVHANKMGIGLVKLPGGYIAIGDFVTAEVAANYQLMLEDFYQENGVIMVRKSSPYLAKVNQLIQRLREGGLLLAWETQVALKYMDYKIQLAIKYSRLKKETVVGPLGLNALVGVFFVYLAGILTSGVAFALEIIVYRRNTCKVRKEIII